MAKFFIKKKKIGNLLSTATICIILVAAFSLLGVSYAAWNQSFRILGSINTGEVNVVVSDVLLDNSDDYQSFSLEKDMQGSIVEQVNMRVATDTNPFNATLIFVVHNKGTVPIICEGIDSNVQDALGIELVDCPDTIDVGETAYIKIKITKSYCKDFEFSTFFKFEQSIG